VTIINVLIHDHDEQQIAIFVGGDDQDQPGKRRQCRADQDVALAPAAEERERVGQDAGEGFQVPRQPGPEKERGIRGPVGVQFVLEQVLQRQARQNLGLRQGGGQHAGDDDECGINEGSVGSLTGGAAMRGFTLFSGLDAWPIRAAYYSLAPLAGRGSG
jgi:hypothetical protein